LAEIVQAIRDRHNIPGPFEEVRLDDDSLTFFFSRQGPIHPASDSAVPTDRITGAVLEGMAEPEPNRPRRRRARKRRNRMKTRGWPVAAKITNRRSQTAVIYKPFVDALSEEGISKREKRRRVGDILRANGNRPSASSIEYFLENTLEYLQQQKTGVVITR
jgi:hypothetical protein